MEKNFAYQCHHWGANKKIIYITKKRSKRPEALGLIENRLEIPKPGNLRIKFDGNLHRKAWVPRRPDKIRRDEVEVIDSE